MLAFFLQTYECSQMKLLPGTLTRSTTRGRLSECRHSKGRFQTVSLMLRQGDKNDASVQEKAKSEMLLLTLVVFKAKHVTFASSASVRTCGGWWRGAHPSRLELLGGTGKGCYF